LRPAKRACGGINSFLALSARTRAPRFCKIMARNVSAGSHDYFWPVIGNVG
jgi:hypothetical protein